MDDDIVAITKATGENRDRGDHDIFWKRAAIATESRNYNLLFVVADECRNELLKIFSYIVHAVIVGSLKICFLRKKVARSSFR